jgi:hypothetical protein
MSGLFSEIIRFRQKNSSLIAQSAVAKRIHDQRSHVTQFCNLQSPQTLFINLYSTQTVLAKQK